MIRKLPHLVFALALSGFAALGLASDSDFVADEIRGLHSELADTRRWVDSDIRANLAHRWETIPNRLAERGFGWAESGLESLSWIPNADLAVESDSAGRLAGFSAGGTGLLWTGESAAVGFQPWGRWTDGGENDAASFGVFSRRALGDWVVVGGNVFADYAANGEFGDFARWSAGLDFQSALGELRGNYYAGLSSTRERVGLENRVLAYAPSGVDAELRLRWFGGSEWSGFAEYEKWSGQFGDADLEEVGYGLSFRPAGGGLLAGLQVDAGYRDSEEWNLRFGYFRTLGADNSVWSSGSAFAVRSALVAPVAREREIQIVAVTVQEKRVAGQARFFPLSMYPRVEDERPWIATVYSRCSQTATQAPNPALGILGTVIFSAAEHESRFDELCDAIQMGGDVDYRGNINATPLHRAVSGMAVDNLKLLIAARADVNLQNDNRATPLDRAQILSERTDDSAELAILQTLAMLLVDSGGKCVRKETTSTLSLCNQSTESLRDGWDGNDYSVSDMMTIYTNHVGDIYHFKHPYAEGATVSRIVSTKTEFEILADGRFRKAEGQNLRPSDGNLGIAVEMHDSESGTKTYLILHLRILQVVHPNPLAFSTIPKVANGYTGAVFSVTVVPESGAYFLAFESTVNGQMIINGGTFHQVASIFNGIFRMDLPVLTITSTGGNFEGRTIPKGMQVLMKRPASVFNPPVVEINANITPNDYAVAVVKHVFTLSVVANLKTISVSVKPGQTGNIHTILADFADSTFSTVSGSSKLTVTRKGIVQLTTPLTVGDKRQDVTIKAVSPNLAGEFFYIVQVRLDCTSRFGHGVYSHSDKHAYTTSNNDLFEATWAKNVDDMCAALYDGANPNYAKRENPNELHVESNVLGNLARTTEVIDTPELVETATRMLLEAGARPNDLGEGNLYVGGDLIRRRTTPLHMVSGRGKNFVPYVRLLLQYGANADIVDRYYQTPLFLASQSTSNDPEIFSMLLNATRNVNQASSFWTIPNQFGSLSHSTALHQVGQTGQTYRFAKMLQAGASTNIVNLFGKTACQFEVDCTDARHLQGIFTDGENINAVDLDGLAELHKAAFAKNLKFVEDLLAVSGVNPKVETTKYYFNLDLRAGSTPLDFVFGDNEDAREVRKALNDAIAQCGINSHYDCD